MVLRISFVSRKLMCKDFEPQHKISSSKPDGLQIICTFVLKIEAYSLCWRACQWMQSFQLDFDLKNRSIISASNFPSILGIFPSFRSFECFIIFSVIFYIPSKKKMNSCVVRWGEIDWSFIVLEFYMNYAPIDDWWRTIKNKSHLFEFIGWIEKKTFQKTNFYKALRSYWLAWKIYGHTS